MKTTMIFKLFLAIILTGIIGLYNVQGQTYFSGVGTNTCGAGTTGTNIGCGAGASNTNGINTFVGVNAGFNNTGTGGNSFFGYQSGYTQGTGGENTFIGYNAGYNNSSASNGVLVGSDAGYSNGTGGSNVFEGSESGYYNTSGDSNIFIGSRSAYYNTIGNENTVIGTYAGYGSNTYSFNKNSFLGFQAGYSNTIGNENTFLGYQSGHANTTADSNVFVGSKSGFHNTTGLWNSFLGYGSGFTNTTANANTFFGSQSGYNNTGAGNTFMGYEAGLDNTTANYNTFIGTYAGWNNTATHNVYVGHSTGHDNLIGAYNTGIGELAIEKNLADSNTAVGYKALNANTTGAGNTALGFYAGLANQTGDSNTFVGCSSNANANNLHNCGSFGYGAISNASRKIRVGNSAITVIEGQVNWSWPSDGRFKFNITQDVKGLEFINKLRPVNYQFDTKAFDQFLVKNMSDSIKNNYGHGFDYSSSKNIIHTGFIAQEVEQAAKDCGYNFEGVHVPVDDNDNYSLAYSEFVVPLVKAMQELNKKVDSLMALPKGANDRTMHNNGDETGKSETTLQVELANDFVLYQNEPNPFDGSTIIRYFIPEISKGNAFIIFNDMFGHELKKVEITEKGFGNINADTKNLTNGIYSYSLMIGGIIKDTKKMLKE